jgi:hypothetical protein
VLPQLTAGLQDRYTIERLLGRGGMATVYLANDLKHARQVALKVFASDVSPSIGAERFIREIKTTAQLTHPNILSLYDSGEVGGLLYYVMPYVKGESLRHLLNREQQLPVAEAVRIAIQIAQALSYAHTHGVIHRDIKPENLLLPHRGHVWVADFGIAKALHDASEGNLTVTSGIVGSPVYMSPEQFSAGPQVGPAADIYSLGCVLYEMLTGNPPFSGPTLHALLAQHVTQKPRSVRAIRLEIPQWLDAAVLKALSKEPAGRFSGADDFANALSWTERGGARADSLRSANLGQYVSRTCNRWKQVNAFEAAFRSACQSHAGRPQFYLVHGEEGQAHESFVERLIATRINHFAAEIGGVECGTVLNVRSPWPQDDKVEVRRRDLTISLFREIAPSYMGLDMSASAFAKLAAASLSPITIVQHDLHAAHWDATTDDLIRWYVNSFWSALQNTDSRRVFLVFLKVIYPPERPSLRLLQKLLRPQTDRRLVKNRLSPLLVDALCPAVVLPELQSVTMDDVKSWFGQNGIYDSERRRRELTEAIFQTAGVKRMSEVEHSLEQIHREFVREVSARHWSEAW